MCWRSFRKRSNKADNDTDAIAQLKTVLGYFPQNCEEAPPYIEPQDSPVRECPKLRKLLPDNPRRAFDMRKAIKQIVDDKTFFEVKKKYVKETISKMKSIDIFKFKDNIEFVAKFEGQEYYDEAKKTLDVFVETIDKFSK